MKLTLILIFLILSPLFVYEVVENWYDITSYPATITIIEQPLNPWEVVGLEKGKEGLTKFDTLPKVVNQLDKGCTLRVVMSCTGYIYKVTEDKTPPIPVTIMVNETPNTGINGGRTIYQVRATINGERKVFETSREVWGELEKGCTYKVILHGEWIRDIIENA